MRNKCACGKLAVENGRCWRCIVAQSRRAVHARVVRLGASDELESRKRLRLEAAFPRFPPEEIEDNKGLSIDQWKAWQEEFEE